VGWPSQLIGCGQRLMQAFGEGYAKSAASAIGSLEAARPILAMPSVALATEAKTQSGEIRLNTPPYTAHHMIII
jgi:hypothetical protein